MPHILVAEDDPGVQFVVRDLLEAHGYHVSVAADVAAARAVLDRESIDLVITDDGLRIDGGRTIKDAFPPPEVPTIVMTGHPERMRALFAAGADFLPKPFKVVELLACVQRIVGGETSGV